MKRGQFTLLLVVGIACVLLSLITIAFAYSNRQLQATVQAQQTLINKGALSRQIGTNLLREMGAVAQTDSAMRQLLEQNGYNLTRASSPAPRP